MSAGGLPPWMDWSVGLAVVVALADIPVASDEKTFVIGTGEVRLWLDLACRRRRRPHQLQSS